MNIFYVHPSPEFSACMLCDKHVVKMSTESAQMLANCFSEEVLAEENTPRTQSGSVRKYSHWNHPSSVWVRASRKNMAWLIAHAIELCHEKKRRYPDNPMPFVYEFLVWVRGNVDRSEVPEGVFTEPPQCIPDCRKVEGDAVAAYRNYYLNEKAGIAEWRYSSVPVWFVDGMKQRTA